VSIFQGEFGATMIKDGNGTNGRNGNHRWWQAWKRDRDLDLASYRRLAFQLHYGLSRTDGVSRSVLVVTPNESKYWAKGCVTLATCMAEELRRPVILVDGDDRSEVCQMLESPGSHGLVDFLREPKRPLQELALATSQPNLSFLPTGNNQGSPIPASTENAKVLLLECARHWEFAVIAGGPVLQNSFPLAMAPYVGRVLLLVTENRTHVDDIDAAQLALEQCGAQNVNLVLTQFDEVLR
jgi:hypothetical protein